jgi:hypothetical protein
MARALRPWCVCAALAGVASCGGDSPASTRSPIPVQLAVTPIAPGPGQSITVTVSATPPAGDAIRLMRIDATGAATYADSATIGTDGGATLTRAFALPLAIGTVHVVGSVRLGSGRTGSTETSFQLTDSLPPIVHVSVAGPDTLTAQPGDTLHVTLSASDNISLKYTALHVTGAVSFSDSVGYTSRQASVSRTILVPVPRSAPLDQGVHLQAEAGDIGRNRVDATISGPAINDVQPPSVTATVSGAQANGGFAPGSTARVVVTASDNVALTRIGAVVEGLSAGDSVAVSGGTGQLTVSVPLSAGVRGTFPVRIFAVDDANNRSELIGAVLTVDSRARRAIVSAAMTGVRDLAIDDKRGLVYASQPDSNEIHVVSRTDASQSAPIVVPGRPEGIDMSLGEDSLVAALGNTATLASVNLATGAVTSIPIIAGSFLSQRPDRVRVAANDRAVYSLTFSGSGFGGNVRDVDLATGQSIGVIGVTESTPMAVSGNRERVLGLIDDSCCPEAAFVYDASTGRFGPEKGTISRYFPGVAADFDGSEFMIGNELFDANLSFVKSLQSAGSGAAVALSPDGAYAYAATSVGVARIRVSDDMVVEAFDTGGQQPVVMRLSTDGLTLAVATASRLYVIDLW